MADQEEQARKMWEEQAKKMGSVIAKCWSDDGFKKKLLADPAATLKAEGVKFEVVTNKAEGKYASAHDLRRSFCPRWAKRIMPADLKVLARHSSINTTMRFYVTQNADDAGSRLRMATRHHPGTNGPEATGSSAIENDAKADRINA